MIDARDGQILSILQRNARTPNAEIARRLSMAASAVHERIRKLEARGVIRGYEVRIDPRAVDLDLLAFVFVKTNEPYGSNEAGDALASLAEVQEVHHITGKDCYLVKVRAADPEALGRLCRERIGAIGSIQSTNTTVVLGTLKEGTALPIARSEDITPARRRAAAAARTGPHPAGAAERTAPRRVVASRSRS